MRKKILRNHRVPAELSASMETVLREQAERRRTAMVAGGCATFSLGNRGNAPAIICLCCGLGSSNLSDISDRYCGFCKTHHTNWVDEPLPMAEDRPVAEPDARHKFLIHLLAGAISAHDCGIPLPAKPNSDMGMRKVLASLVFAGLEAGAFEDLTFDEIRTGCAMLDIEDALGHYYAEETPSVTTNRQLLN